MANSVLLDPDDRVILGLNHVRSMLKQCSRQVPQHVEGVWMPAWGQIEELEERLPKAHDAALGSKNKSFSSGLVYVRQYGGLVVGGKRLIYLNAFPQEGHSRKWKENADITCDGGPNYFGAEYDPETRSFLHFEFNGGY